MIGRHAYEHYTRNIYPVHAPVVTLSVVVTAMQFVTLQQGCTFVGEATDVPMVSVGVVAAEQGTQTVQ